MRRRVIGIVSALLILIIVISTRDKFGVDVSKMASYYYFALTSMSIMVFMVLGVSIVYRLMKSEEDTEIEETDQEINRRDFFRIVYEPSERPSLKIKNSDFHFEKERNFEILDISEQGVRFSIEGKGRIEDTIEGELIFPSGRLLKIEGDVVRKKEGEMVLLLTTPISYEFIVREQRRIITDNKRA